jgi:flavodoxin I
MMYQVLYYSRGGNTRKIADVIAEEIGVKARDFRYSPLDPGAKVIFLGSGVYAGKPGEDMMRFIEANDFRGRKVAIFSTSWRTGEDAFDGMANALRRKGAIVQRGYHCKGRAGIFNLGHPNRGELDGARAFARDMARAG